MTNESQQTVDLKKQPQRESRRPEQKQSDIYRGKTRQAESSSRRASSHAGESRRAEEIDKVYNDEEEGKTDKQDLRKINRPIIKQVNEPLFKRITFIVAIIFIGLVCYWLFFGRGGNENTQGINQNSTWYAVKLVDEEMYYGQISDIKADPIVINNVYYDYDQQNKDNTGESNNLRLVKRGQETHGPSGSMNIVRSQVLYMEPLREDSKVLKAILDYEQ